MISADLPFAQSRFCGAEGLDNVIMLSTMRGRDFHKDYGVMITDPPAVRPDGPRRDRAGRKQTG